MVNTRTLLAVSASVLMTSCLPESGTRLPVLDHALEAGQGIGDLQLGESTFLECLLATPGWKSTFSGSDEGYTVELYWPAVALRLEFALGRESLQTMELRVLKTLVIDAENTARAQPAIGKAQLSRISFGPPRMSDRDDGQPCGGVVLDGMTHTSVQLGADFDTVVAAVGPGDSPKDPVLPRKEGEAEDAPPRYREGSFSLSWPGLSIGFTKPRGSDPEEQPYVTSFVIYVSQGDD